MESSGLGKIELHFEVVSVRDTAAGIIPDVPPSAHKIFVPNFEKTALRELKTAFVNLQNKYPHHKIVPTLPVRKYSLSTVHEVLLLFQNFRMNELLVLAGNDFSAPRAKGSFDSTVDFLQKVDLSLYDIHTIYVAGHPEYHPHMSTKERLKALQMKYDLAQRQNLSFAIITQVICNPEKFALWQKSVRAAGIPSKIFYGALCAPIDPGAFKNFAVDLCHAIPTNPKHPDFDLKTAEMIQHPEKMLFPEIVSTLAEIGTNVDGFHLYQT